MAEIVPPSTQKVSFNCPRCGALAHQTWYYVYADALKKENMPTVRDKDEIDKSLEGLNEELASRLRKLFERQARGEIFF